MKISELVEGAWAFPDTPKKIKALKKIMNHPLPAGKAGALLFPILGNSDLHDQIEVFADDDPERCIRNDVMQYIRHNYHDVFKQLAKSNDWNASREPEDKMLGDYGEFTPLGHDEVKPS